MTHLLWAMVFCAAPAAGAKLTIDAPQKVYRPGHAMPLRFTIENAGDAEAKLEEPDNYLEGLEVIDADGKVLKATGRTRGITRRTPSVEAGGFIGRTVDISGALAIPEDKEGWYRIRWSFGDDRSNEVSVLVVRDWLATLETNYGAITLEFYPETAPNHVLNFLRLAREGFYKDSNFHRIIPGFMMQGGAPQDPKKDVKPLKAEFSARKHGFGTVSMARTQDPDSATSQFFICFGATPHLDGAYSIFGQVVKGEEVVKKIEQVKSDHNPCRQCGLVPPRPGATPCCGRHHLDKPDDPVIIKDVALRTEPKK